MKEVKVGKVRFSDKHLGIIAGPCVIEDRDHSLKMASEIKIISEKLDLPIIFKSSFDKANRSSISSFRGLGIEEGLSILQKVKSETDLPVITDIHEPIQASAISEVADVIQIPAFLRMIGSWGCLITCKNAGIIAFAVLGAFSVVLRAVWGSLGLICPLLRWS